MIQTATTDGQGRYLFAGLTSGATYVVGVAPANFTGSGPLVGHHSSLTSISGSGLVVETAPGDPDTDTDDNDDNGRAMTSGFYAGGVLSPAVTLASGAEPTGESPDNNPGSTPDANSNLTVDFGFYSVAVGNHVWVDDGHSGGTLDDGSLDGGEAGIDAVTVELFAADGTTEITVGPDGRLGSPDDTPGGVADRRRGYYQFRGLPEGDYVAWISVPSGYRSSTDPDDGLRFRSPSSPMTTVPASQRARSSPRRSPSCPDRPSTVSVPTAADGTTANPRVDFGLVPDTTALPALVAVGDRTWIDTDQDGVQDSDESPIAGVTVQLLRPDGVTPGPQRDERRGTPGRHRRGRTLRVRQPAAGFVHRRVHPPLGVGVHLHGRRGVGRGQQSECDERCVGRDHPRVHDRRDGDRRHPSGDERRRRDHRIVHRPHDRRRCDRHQRNSCPVPHDDGPGHHAAIRSRHHRIEHVPHHRRGRAPRGCRLDRAPRPASAPGRLPAELTQRKRLIQRDRTGSDTPGPHGPFRRTVGPCSARSTPTSTNSSGTASGQFLEREVVPHREEWDRAGLVDREVFESAGASGFLGIDVPEEHGGGGVQDFRYNAVIAEEIQQAGVNAMGLGLTLHNDICMPYFLHQTNDEQRRRWLPGICAGTLITAVAMTEPGIGSDLASMTTTAIRDGDHYVVNGSKTFITNGINADLVITAVKTDPSQSHAGMSLLSSNGAWRASSAAATSTRSACTPRTPRSCSSPTCACRSRTGSARRGRGSATSCRTWPRSASRSPSPVWRPPGPRSTGRSSTARSASRSASRSGRSRTAGSSSPR